MTDREKFNEAVEKFRKANIKIYGLQTPSGLFDNRNRFLKMERLEQLIIKTESVDVRECFKIIESW